MSDSRRNIATLIPAGITFLALCGLLFVARFWEYLPLKPPGCNFRKITGIPCIGCGGTRCMMALSHGDVVKSFLFNPIIFLGIVTIIVWFAVALRRYLLRIEPSPLTDRQLGIRRIFLKFGLPVLVLLNWIYLAMYLPEV